MKTTDLDKLITDFTQEYNSAKAYGSTPGKNLFDTLCQIYDGCATSSSKREWFIKRLSEFYPYTDVIFNIGVTKYFRRTWTGRALLLSVFTGTFIFYAAERFWDADETECYFSNDKWIGTIETDSGRVLPFVSYEGVTSCQDYFLNSSEQNSNLRKAALSLLGIYSICSWQENPGDMWAEFLVIYAGIYGLIKNLIDPEIDKLKAEGYSYLKQSFALWAFVTKEGEMLASNGARPNSYYNMVMKIADPFGRFLDCMGDFLIGN